MLCFNAYVARCDWLLNTKSWDFIKTGSLCYPFKRTSGYIPINMENKMNLLQYPVTLFHKKVDSAIAAKMVGKFSGEMRRYPKKQQIDTRHTQLRN